MPEIVIHAIVGVAPFLRGAKKRLVAIIRGWGQAVQYAIRIAARLWNLPATSLEQSHMVHIESR